MSKLYLFNLFQHKIVETGGFLLLISFYFQNYTVNRCKVGGKTNTHSVDNNVILHRKDSEINTRGITKTKEKRMMNAKERHISASVIKWCKLLGWWGL